MTNRLWWATLNSSSPRYKTWRDILDGDEVPLKHPAAQRATLGVPAIERTAGSPGMEENVEVYAIDIHAMSDLQIKRLIAFVSAKFHAPAKDVELTIGREGFPIRAEDVTVAYSMRAFL